MSGFLRALPYLMTVTDGFVDDPADPGSATNRGISQNTFNVWLGSRSEPKRSVRDITEDEVRTIYYERCWLAGKCDALAWPLSAAHFLACVSHGPDAAAQQLRQAVGRTAVGRLDPRTLEALEATDPVGTLHDLLWSRLAATEGRSDADTAAELRIVLELRSFLDSQTPETVTPAIPVETPPPDRSRL